MPMLPPQARATLPAQAGGAMRPAMPAQAGGAMRPAMPAQAQGVPVRPDMPAQAQGVPPAFKKGGFVPFEKSGKDNDKKLPPWMKEGSPKEEKMDSKQAKKFADGGDVKLANDEGDTTEELKKKGKTWNSLTSQTEAERWGRQAGAEDYPRERRTQESLGQPAKALRKGSTWVKEQYGDARDSTRGLLTGDPEHGEFRKGQQAIRKRELGYAGGGMVRRGYGKARGG